MTEEIRNRLAKIKALADRGVGGEKENAEALLARLLAKYNIQESDLLDDVVESHEFSYYGIKGRELFNQIVYAVIGEGYTIQKYTYKRNCNTRFVRCTKAQAIEIKEMFEFYRYHLDQGIDLYFSAFIQKEYIFPEGSHSDGELTEEDKKMLQLARHLDKHERRLMIEEKSSVF